MVVLLTACNDDPLLKNLSEQQANEVVAVLQSYDLSVKKEDLGKTGYAVQVDHSDFPAAVDLLKQRSLPSAPRVEIANAFPGDAMVASPGSEQARLLSAVEQRLEQNLAAMPNVASAHVQVNYPLRVPAPGQNDVAMHVAVLMSYRNAVDENVLTTEVKRFVKNSFANIDYDDISVVLNRAAPVYRTIATRSPSGGMPAWLYWLALIPIALAAVGGALFYGRRRSRSSDDTLGAEPGAMSVAHSALAAEALPAPSGDASVLQNAPTERTAVESA